MDKEQDFSGPTPQNMLHATTPPPNPELDAYMMQIARDDTGEVIVTVRPDWHVATSNDLFHFWWGNLSRRQRAWYIASGFVTGLPAQFAHQWWRFRHHLIRKHS